MANPLLSYPEAAALVLAEAQRLTTAISPSTERLPLLASLGRVLATPVTADRDHPPFHRSTRDGYAVLAATLTQDSTLPILGSIRAGDPPATNLPPDAALEIMTGAPVPPGADSVVMLEHVQAQDATIRLLPGRTLRPGDNIVPAGSEARAGDPLVPASTRLTPPQIAALAAAGAAEVDVYRRPRVAIVATGDELVEIEATPLPHQIRNSNGATLAAQVLRAGGEPQQLGIARDSLDALRTLLDRAGERCDLLLLSGGVSAGRYDLVEQALAERGAVFHFTGVRIQPGKPAVFGELPRPEGAAPLPFFGLPGNPVSTMVTFLLFAAPMLRSLSGDAAPGPRFAQAQLAAAEPAAAVTRFLPAYLAGGWDHATVRRIPWLGSGDLAATAQSNCFVVLPPDTALATGTTVQVLLP